MSGVRETMRPNLDAVYDVLKLCYAVLPFRAHCQKFNFVDSTCSRPAKLYTIFIVTKQQTKTNSICILSGTKKC